MEKFQREPLSVELIDELIPLMVEHDRAVSSLTDIPLDPDYDTYLAAEAAGRLRVYTARDEATGKLIGYDVFFVYHNLQRKKCLQAEQSALFARPGTGAFGARFIAWTDEALRAEGAMVVARAVKETCDYSPILERRGYQPMETVWHRRFQEGSHDA